MNRITLLLCAVVAISSSANAARKAGLDAPEGTQRLLKIVVAQDAAPAVKDAAKEIMAGVNASPVLQIMSDGKPAEMITSEDLAKAKVAERAFNYLVLVGMPDDPIIQQAWLRDARLIKTGESSGLYVFGFGNLLGDIGYVESDRNPFLHSAAIKQAPYETEFITISGSTPAGVKLAADAFLKNGLINGVVASSWKRGDTTLLDRDPLKPGAGTPDVLAGQVGKWKLIGVTQPGEDEYRGVLADAGVEPQIIWRGKYYAPGAWDGAGWQNSLQDFNDGLHRRAYGDTVWAASFASQQEATEAAPKIAAAAHLKKEKGDWVGKLGPLGPEKESAGSIMLQQHGQWLLMSTVPIGD